MTKMTVSVVNCYLVNDERRVMIKIFLKILSEVKKGFGFK